AVSRGPWGVEELKPAVGELADRRVASVARVVPGALDADSRELRHVHVNFSPVWYVDPGVASIRTARRNLGGDTVARRTNDHVLIGDPRQDWPALDQPVDEFHLVPPFGVK